MFLGITVVKTFNVQIRVNKTFLPGYTNLSSSESLTFIHNFTARTEDVFRARLSHFNQTEVKSLLNESVLVDLDVEVYSLSNASTIAIERALEDANSFFFFFFFFLFFLFFFLFLLLLLSLLLLFLCLVLVQTSTLAFTSSISPTGKCKYFITK